jgi:hypothetical protein
MQVATGRAQKIMQVVAVLSDMYAKRPHCAAHSVIWSESDNIDPRVPSKWQKRNDFYFTNSRVNVNGWEQQ